MNARRNRRCALPIAALIFAIAVSGCVETGLEPPTDPGNQVLLNVSVAPNEYGRVDVTLVAFYGDISARLYVDGDSIDKVLADSTFVPSGATVIVRLNLEAAGLEPGDQAVIEVQGTSGGENLSPKVRTVIVPGFTQWFRVTTANAVPGDSVTPADAVVEAGDRSVRSNQNGFVQMANFVRGAVTVRARDDLDDNAIGNYYDAETSISVEANGYYQFVLIPVLDMLEGDARTAYEWLEDVHGATVSIPPKAGHAAAVFPQSWYVGGDTEAFQAQVDSMKTGLLSINGPSQNYDNLEFVTDSAAADVAFIVTQDVDGFSVDYAEGIFRVNPQSVKRPLINRLAHEVTHWFFNNNEELSNGGYCSSVVGADVCANGMTLQEVQLLEILKSLHRVSLEGVPDTNGNGRLLSEYLKN